MYIVKIVHSYIDIYTNSSSTSFIISTKNDLNKSSFLESIGVENKCILNKFFEDLFDSIEINKRNIIDVIKEDPHCKDIEKFLKQEGFNENTISKVTELINMGQDVFFGTFRSDAAIVAEAYFCCESFIVCEDDIYFNGNISGW